MKQLKQVEIEKWKVSNREQKPDFLAVEEPLEMAIAYHSAGKRQRSSVAVTMRTPGNDFELTRGFLFTEGIIGQATDIVQLRFQGAQLASNAQQNVVLAELHPTTKIDPSSWTRHFYASSSCGICGKASIEMIQSHSNYILVPDMPQIDFETLCKSPEHLLEEQKTFTKTGGLHAAGLFNKEGDLILLREDVGRHNALDKLIGAALSKGMVPLKDYFLVLSGRLSFELIQKAIMAGIPFVAAVGAPSSLALELAEEYGMTLVGFLKAAQFNVYCGAQRIIKRD